MRYITRILATFMFLLVLAAPLQTAGATDVFHGACSNPAAKNSTVCTTNRNPSNPIVGPHGIILKITRIIAIAAGIAAVVIIVISGIRYAVSGGDSAGTAGARNAIIYAIVGLIVIILAQSIISFVVARL